jgi:hypothetical protein
MRRLTALALCLLALAPAASARQQAQQAKPGRQGPPGPAAPAASAQAADADRSRLRAQAEELTKAFLGGDYDKAADLTHPAVVSMAGGKAKMVAFIEQGMREMRDAGFVVEAFTVGDAKQIVGASGSLYAVLPTVMRAKTPRGLVALPSFLIGVSSDGGGRWTFVSGNGMTKEQLKLMFPQAADKLELPAAGPLELLEKP